MLFAVWRCLLLVVCLWLLIAACSFVVVGCLLLFGIVLCLFLFSCSLLFVVVRCLLLLAVSCRTSLWAAVRRWLSFDVCCLSCIVVWFVVCCVWFVVCGALWLVVAGWYCCCWLSVVGV